jgi:3-hydroxybutyryl-CoA dehydratase
MFIEELSIGQSHETRKIVTQKDIQMFADVSGDHNPVHLDAEFAAQTPFKGVIAHGMLSASFISAILGTELPGKGTIYLGQSLRFMGPVRPGDEVRTVVTVKEIVVAKKRVICQTAGFVGDKQVIDGEATLLVPTNAAS